MALLASPLSCSAVTARVDGTRRVCTTNTSKTNAYGVIMFIVILDASGMIGLILLLFSIVDG